MKVDSETRKRAKAVYRILTKTYPNIRCELDFTNPLELIIATVLSAQCTDKRVNTVTPALFKKYKNPRAYAKADLHEIEDLVHSTGFYRAKARNIKALNIKLLEDFGGEVPRTLEELITLPGVGRKTANVVLGHAFDTPGITVDTHFGRLSRRFEWSDSKDPVKVEIDVQELIPEKEWTNLSQRMIWHGRRVCHSRKPACGACPLAKICPSVGIGEMLVLASAFFFAAHIIALGKWSSGRDVYAMTIVQLAMCAVLSGLASIPEGYSPPPDNGVWGVVIFTAVICTAVAFVVQTWSQAHMTTTKVAVILTMEVVFAAIFAMIFGGERLTLQATLGGVMVLTAMFMIVLKEN